jgi:SAM-dependent methyltransferase
MSNGGAEFDRFAHDYEQTLNRGLSASGETKDFFARGRVAWMNKCLQGVQYYSGTILDFGCGTGSGTRELLSITGVESVTGVEISPESLRIAQRTILDPRIRFFLSTEHPATAAYDLAYCNGVFHHIAPAERLEALRYIHRRLRPGSYFSFWENNPWNPGTRYIMRRIPFDRDAIPISAGHARKLLIAAGFEPLRTDFLFIFPRLFRLFRPLEPKLTSLPLGAQYQVFARKFGTNKKR